MRQQAEACGHSLEMAVWDKESDSSWVHSMRSRRGTPACFCDGVLRILDQRLGLGGLTGLAGWRLPASPYFRNADVIHLHLINNMCAFSVLSLPRLSRFKPLVWTIHDCWALTGGCIYSFECNRWLSGCKGFCPYPRVGAFPFRTLMPALHWFVKKQVCTRSDLSLVVASDWTRERVQRSPLLSGLPCRKIPFGIDIAMFSAGSKAAARERLGIAREQRVIAFRAASLKCDLYKGMRWIHEALRLYQPKMPVCLLAIEDGSDFLQYWPKYAVFSMGWIDGDRLVDVLRAADVFLMPSIQESFGLMAVEAMACGTPVITFDGTSLPGVIRVGDLAGGVSVPSRDSAALAEALGRLIEDVERTDRLSKEARILAEREYSHEAYVRQHLVLYEEVIARHKDTHGARA